MAIWFAVGWCVLTPCPFTVTAYGQTPRPRANAEVSGNAFVKLYRELLTGKRPADENEPPKVASIWRHPFRIVSPEEQELLRGIRGRPEAQRLRILEAFVAAVADPRQGDLPLEYITHAVVGLDAPMRTKVIDDLLRPRLSRQELSQEERQAWLRVALALDVAGQIPGVATQAVALLLIPREDGEGPRDPWLRLHRLEAVVSSAPPPEKAALCELLLTALSPSGVPNEGRTHLGRITEHVLSQLDDHEFAAVAPTVARIQRQQPFFIPQKDSALHQRLLRHFSDDEGKMAMPPPWLRVHDFGELKRATLQTLGDNPFLSAAEVLRAASSLSLPDLQWTAEERRLVASRLVAVVAQVGEPDLISTYVKTISHVGDLLTAEEVQAVVESLMTTVIGSKGDRYVYVDMMRYAGGAFEQFCTSIAPAESAATARLLMSKRGRDPALEPLLRRGLPRVASKLPAAQAKELIRECVQPVSDGDAALSETMIAAAQQLNAEERMRVEDFLLKQLRAAGNGEPPPSRIRLELRAMFGVALSHSSLDATRANEAISLILDEFLDGDRERWTSGGGRFDTIPTPLAESLRESLSGLFLKLAADDRAAAARRFQETLRQARGSSSTDVLCEVLVAGAERLRSDEARESFTALVILFQKDGRQHRRTPGYLQQFVPSRPPEERAQLVHILGKAILAEGYRTYSYESHTALIQGVCDSVPEADAYQLLLALVAMFEHIDRDTPLDGLPLVHMAARVAAPHREACAAMLIEKIEAAADALVASVYARCVNAMPSLSAEQRALAAKVIIERMHDWILPAGLPKFVSESHIASIGQQLQGLVRGLPPVDAVEIGDRLTELLEIGTSGMTLTKSTYQRRYLFDLVRPLSSLGVDLTPDATRRLMRAYAVNFVGLHRSTAAKDRAYLAALKGKLPPGEATRLWRDIAAAWPRVSTTERQHFLGTYGMTARYVPADEVDECFALGWKLLKSALDPHPHEPAFFNPIIVRHFGPGLEQLAERISPAKSAAAWEETWELAQEQPSESLKTALSHIAGALLCPTAKADMESYWRLLDKLPPLDKQQQWRIYGYAVATAAPEKRSEIVATILQRATVPVTPPELEEMASGISQWPVEACIELVRQLADQPGLSAEQREALLLTTAAMFTAELPADSQLLLADPSHVGIAQSIILNSLLRTPMGTRQFPSVWGYLALRERGVQAEKE